MKQPEAKTMETTKRTGPPAFLALISTLAIANCAAESAPHPGTSDGEYSFRSGSYQGRADAEGDVEWHFSELGEGAFQFEARDQAAPLEALSVATQDDGAIRIELRDKSASLSISSTGEMSAAGDMEALKAVVGAFRADFRESLSPEDRDLLDAEFASSAERTDSADQCTAAKRWHSRLKWTCAGYKGLVVGLGVFAAGAFFAITTVGTAGVVSAFEVPILVASASSLILAANKSGACGALTDSWNFHHYLTYNFRVDVSESDAERCLSLPPYQR